MARGGADPRPAAAAPPRCPICAGTLGPPVSRDVHCFVTCLGCGEEFELDDPRLAARGG
ncbi:MAG TPA: hypothetical protein VML94_03515 [Thermoplasmata archaeon]|nr:hypothetical protein [Thermoplasmata archaeon]